MLSSLQAPHGPRVGGVRLPHPSASSGCPTLGLGSRFTLIPTALHVQNVGHAKGVIIQAVSRQLLYGPDKRFTFNTLWLIHTKYMILHLHLHKLYLTLNKMRCTAHMCTNMKAVVHFFFQMFAISIRYICLGRKI